MSELWSDYSDLIEDKTEWGKMVVGFMGVIIVIGLAVWKLVELLICLLK